jgi:hypothetical protein
MSSAAEKDYYHSTTWGPSKKKKTKHSDDAKNVGTKKDGDKRKDVVSTTASAESIKIVSPLKSTSKLSHADKIATAERHESGKERGQNNNNVKRVIDAIDCPSQTCNKMNLSIDDLKRCERCDEYKGCSDRECSSVRCCTKCEEVMCSDCAKFLICEGCCKNFCDDCEHDEEFGQSFRCKCDYYVCKDCATCDDHNLACPGCGAGDNEDTQAYMHNLVYGSYAYEEE